MECLFCDNYNKWSNEGKIVFENPHAYSILSPTPSTPGHAIVIPKIHIQNIRELTGQALEDFIYAIPDTFNKIIELYKHPEQIITFYESLRQNPITPASKTQAELMLNHPSLKIKPQAYNEGSNNGNFAGQSVKHIHTHLFPRSSQGKGIAEAMRNFLSQ